MRIYIVCEDNTSNGYDAEPLKIILSGIIKNIVQVEILESAPNPMEGRSYPNGVDWIFDNANAKSLVSLYKNHCDLVIIIVDRDKKEERTRNAQNIQNYIYDHCQNLPNLCFMVAWECVEHWIVSGLNDMSDEKWNSVKSKKSKKSVLTPISKSRGLQYYEDEGRFLLAEESIGNIVQLLSRCSNDQEFGFLLNFLQSYKVF